MKKIQLLVVFGGMSSEYSVSCVSTASVIQNLDTDKYDIIKVGITEKGEWFYTEASPEKIKDGSWTELSNTRAFLSPDRVTSGLILMKDFEMSFKKIDVAFPVMHGAFGEDGAIQGLFELAGISYVGPHIAASAVCMDKSITKTIIAAAGIEQAKWCSFSEFEFSKNSSEIIDKLEKELLYPIFIKPAKTGSSVGISKAKDKDSLLTGIDEAFKYDDKIVAEEFIDGFEIETAVLGNEMPMVSVCGEIAPAREFYDFKAKYNDDKSLLFIPARIDGETSEKVRENALLAYKATGCAGMSRVDFFVTKKDNRIIFNEINTIPGFTSISMYPKLFHAVGIPYGELLDRLIDYAMEYSQNQ